MLGGQPAAFACRPDNLLQDACAVSRVNDRKFNALKAIDQAR
jgi:hypothetical protein